MTYFAERHIQQPTPRPKANFAASVVQILLAGVYFMLGVSRAKDANFAEDWDAELASLSRPMRRQHSHTARKMTPSARNLFVFKAIVPNENGKTLSQNQFLERCTKLSSMGRFQIYDFLYYRWEFKRKRAIRRSGRAPRSISSPAATTPPCGLSASHLWPD